MQEKIDYRETARQLIHMLLGSAIIAAVIFLGTHATLEILLAIFALAAVASLRLAKGTNTTLLSKTTTVIGRESEQNFPFEGAIFFFLGAIMLLVLFPEKQIVLGGLIVVVYGDAFSTLVGKAVGKTPLPNNKTLEGSIAGFFVSAEILAIFFPLHIALLTALAGMLAELLPVNDNISIPIASAIALTILL